MGIASTIGTFAARPAVQAGALLGGAAAVASFSPTLMPRPTLDQALVTGGSMLGGFAVGAAAYRAASAATTGAARLGAGPAIARVAGPLALAAVGGVAMLAARREDGESVGRSAIRSAGMVTMLGAGAAAAVGAGAAAHTMIAARVPAGRVIGPALIGAAVLGVGAGALTRNLDRSARAHGGDDSPGSALRPIGIGLGVAGAVGGMIALGRAGGGVIGGGLASRLPGPASAWRIAGHAAVLGIVGGLGALAVGKAAGAFERSNHKLEPAYDTPPTMPNVSGGPGSLVGFDVLGRQGRRFVSEAVPAATITEVTGAPAVDPIRVYVGTPAGATIDERVQLAMGELERTGAFERSMLVFASPSGTGFVNPIPIAASEYMSRGDVATVAMQYGSRPSVLSADRVSPGARQNAALLDAIESRLREIPEARRPRLVMYGESLGAHTTQDVFLHEGTDALQRAGVDRALWSGSPFRSEWRQQVLGTPRDDVDPTLVGEFDSIEELQARPDSVNDRMRVVLLTHDNDPVAKFGVDMLVQEPAWLRGNRPETVPDEMSWTPGVTFLQSALDAKNAATVVPGEFASNGHDYRADLAPFVREAYRFDHVDDAELERITSRLVADDLERSRQVTG